jgi:hypothetical protein
MHGLILPAMNIGQKRSATHASRIGHTVALRFVNRQEY